VSGETWEYWEPGEYRNSDDKTFTCLALNTDGLKIYLSQGFGSGCDGLGVALDPKNGLRNMVLEKRMRLEQSCDFPSWLTQSQWQIIIQGGTITSERTTPTQLMFNTSSSFQLMFGERENGQEFSCSKVVSTSRSKVMLHLFSQSQCQGAYQCLQAELHSDSVTLHLGAPTPHLQHSCLAPSFDQEVPFLKATLVQTGTTQQKRTRRPNVIQPTSEHRRSGGFGSKSKLKLINIERRLIAKVNHNNNVFLQKIKNDIKVMFENLEKEL